MKEDTAANKVLMNPSPPFQAANAVIMNRGTPRNILTELDMTTDDYNWVSTAYNVRCAPERTSQDLPGETDSFQKKKTPHT